MIKSIPLIEMVLECIDCDAIYIGQTGRSFKIRDSEHMRSLRQLQMSNSPFDSTSSLADHLIKYNHPHPQKTLILYISLLKVQN